MLEADRSWVVAHGTRCDDGAVTVDQPGGEFAEAHLLDAFDTAALLVDPDARIAYANETARRLYGRPGEPLIGQELLASMFTPAEQEAMETVVRRVWEGRRWRGRLQVRRADGTTHPAEVVCAPRAGPGSGLVFALHDSVIERGSARQFRHLGDRLTRLARVTAELAVADTVEAVTKIVISHGADAVGATVASLTLRDGEDHLRLAGLRGGREGDEARWGRFPLTTHTPSSDAVRTGERVMLVGGDAIAERYPDLGIASRGERSVIGLPLHIATRTIGAIGLSFPGVRTLDEAELEFFDILADTCAQALERISAQQVAARQSAKLVFLADASTELASSLEYQATLAKVARMAVPEFADWCAIDVLLDGRLHRVAVEHVDPAKVELAQQLQDRYPSDPDAPSGAANVVRTGTSELIAEITDEMLVAAAVDEEHLRLARELRLRSALTVPLIARDRVRGAITWVSAESERRYTADDVSLAEDLAKRAAIAIDNAELHSETVQAAASLQQAVLPESMPHIPGWELAHHYSPSGRTEVGGDFYDALRLNDGRIAVFVGDVMGRGVAAAAAMAQIRAAVRAYAAIDPMPETVMSKLDQMFTQYPSEQLVTLVYMLLDPRDDVLVAANAGHPPPLVLRANGSTEELPQADGCPLAAAPDVRRADTLRFLPGDTLLAFTDGLIERRGEDISAGQARARDALPSLAAGDLAAALDTMVAALRDASRDDDVAALAVRRSG